MGTAAWETLDRIDAEPGEPRNEIMTAPPRMAFERAGNGSIDGAVAVPVGLTQMFDRPCDSGEAVKQRGRHAVLRHAADRRLEIPPRSDIVPQPRISPVEVVEEERDASAAVGERGAESPRWPFLGQRDANTVGDRLRPQRKVALQHRPPALHKHHRTKPGDRPPLAALAGDAK